MLRSFSLWLAGVTGALPRITERDIVAAEVEVQAAQRAHAAESAEYRRHVAYRALTDSGIPKRCASLAIEIAIARGAA